MKFKMSIRSGSYYIVTALLVLTLCPVAWGQIPFVVTSTVPADGAVGVDPNGTFTINFSKSLNTSVMFEYPQGFYVNLLLHPDSLVGEPDDVQIDPTLKTISVDNLHLYPNTQYMLLITDAVSLDGDSLDIPYIATFSTGNSLPSAKVTGTISYNSGVPPGVAVMLMNQPLFTDEESEIECAALIPEENGKYQVNYVPPGIYWPIAVWNFYIDVDGDIQPRDNAAFGFYDPDGDLFQDSIVVSEGDSIANIDMGLVDLYPITARENLSNVQTVAKAWASDAALVTVAGNDIAEDGTSWGWQYVFYSTSLQESRGWFAIGTLVIPMEMDLSGMDLTPLPENWIDSNTAADTAEFYGGEQFRQEHAVVSASAILGYSLPFGDDKVRLNYNLNSIDSPQQLPSVNWHRKNVLKRLSAKPVYASESPIWIFLYFAEEEIEPLFIFIDAITGKVKQAVTARQAEAVANSEALSWSSDAQLNGLICPLGINEDGKADFWFFNYYSASLDSFLGIIIVKGMVFGTEPGHSPPGTEIKIVPTNWIDSDVAIAIAEVNGGADYRTSNFDVFVWASLNAGMMPWNPDQVVWTFIYHSSTSEPWIIYIDPITGAVIQPSLVTAREAEAAAKTSALAWAADAKLYMSISPANVEGGVQADGNASFWAFGYYSQSRDSLLGIMTFYGDVVGIEPGNPPPYFALVPEAWINSSDAMSVAEANGGTSYRSSNQDVSVNAVLAAGLYPWQFDKVVWQITYFSGTEAPLTLNIDCLTGQILTKVDEAPDPGTLPLSFELKQNYPNPFNPETKISYAVPYFSRVKIAVYNVFGTEIAMLVDENKAPGNYVVRWNGKDAANRAVPSGLYIYKMETGDYRQMLKMTLIR